MMDEKKQIIAVLSEVINAPDRPPALWPLSYIRYPERELQLCQNTDSNWAVKLYLRGHGYKSNRSPRPLCLPPVIPTAIRAELNDALPDGITVTAVFDNGTYILVIIKEDTTNGH